MGSTSSKEIPKNLVFQAPKTILMNGKEPKYQKEEIKLEENDYDLFKKNIDDYQFEIQIVGEKTNVLQENIIDYLTKNINTEEENIQYENNNFSPITLTSLNTLGKAISYLLLNRFPMTTVKINFKNNNQGKTKNCENIEPICFTPGLTTEFCSEIQFLDKKPPFNDISERIKVYHIHTHFNDKSELRAIQLHRAIIRFLEERNENIVNKGNIRYTKNGPHNVWNWEIHLDHNSFSALGAVITFLAINQSEHIYHPFHCRTYDCHTYNEFYDHIDRLAWIGKIDPIPLDVKFFPHPSN